MKTATLSIILSLFGILIPSKSLAFADWVHEPFPLMPQGLGDLEFTNLQHSDASGKGQISVAFVLNSPRGNSLYFLTYNLYEKSGSIPKFPIPVLIDTANEIGSIQVRHDPLSGETHFVYSLKRETLPEDGVSIPEVEVLRHAVLPQDPGIPPAITRTDIAKRTLFVGIPYEISLKLRAGQSRRSLTPAIAYRSISTVSANSTLNYSERNNDGTWETTQIDFGPHVGEQCELSFSGSDHSAIVYQENNGSTIKLARRTGDGHWNTELALIGLLSTVTDPTLVLDGPYAQIAYVSFSSPTRKLNLRSETPNGVVHTTVRSETNKILDPNMVISEGRIVIAYQIENPIHIANFEPWIATKSSVKSTFTSTKITPPSNGGPSEVGAGFDMEEASISLDGVGYPIISWSERPDGIPRVCYCPDFTDVDCDGIPHLEEVALRMNPHERDLHLYPKGEIYTNAETGRRHFSLTFPTAYSINLSISLAHAFIETGHFRYQVLTSYDLEAWHEGDAYIVQLPPDPSNPSPGSYFRASLHAAIEGSKSRPKGFLRLSISRL